MTLGFANAMQFVFMVEGGYATLANDEETNHGVQRSTWEDYIGHKEKDERFKNLTRADVEPLYLERYWVASGADRVPYKLGVALFDFAVNSGVGRAVKTLQEILGVKVDGVFGIKTAGAVHSADINKLVEQFIDARRAFIKGARNYALYGKGWRNRIDQLEEFIKHA